MKKWTLIFLLAMPPMASAQQSSLLSTFADPSSDGGNIFVGENSGNIFMSPAGGPPFWASANTALGANTLSLNQTGYENTAIGSNALWANIDGYHNTAIGYVALASNSSGADNVAVGHSAMYLNQAGAWNTAIGLQALYSNTTGNNNTAVGRDANFNNTTGNWNTGVGVDAIPGVETGDGNTGVGGESGYTEDLANQNVTGSYNTWVGYQSGPSSPAQHDGVIGIGYRAKTSKDYQAVLGSPAIVETLLFGNVGINADNPTATLVVNGNAVNQTGVWEVYSDQRLKKDISDFKAGLNVIRELHPVSFHYNGLEGLSDERSQVGLIAQEVERVAPEMVSTRVGEDVKDVRVLSPQALQYMLINAIQELESRLTDIERRMDAAGSAR